MLIKVHLKSFSTGVDEFRKAARAEKQSHEYEKFLEEVIAIQNGKRMMTQSIFKQIRLFQFSQSLIFLFSYFFLKYLKDFNADVADQPQHAIALLNATYH